MVINKSYERSDGDEKISREYNITLNGTLVAIKGSPSSSGTFWNTTGYPPDESIDSEDRLRVLLRKRQALDCLFSEDGKLLEIFPLNGTGPIKCRPKIQSIEFEEGLWYEQLKYKVNMTTDTIETVGAAICETGLMVPALKRSSEEWQIEENDKPDTFRLTHVVSAVGKLSYDTNGNETKGWHNAQNWVLPRLGIEQEKIYSSGVHNLPSYYGGFNYVRGNKTNEIEGSYEVTESWILSSGNAIEDFTVEKTTAEDGRVTVGIRGSVEGLETRNNQNWNPRTGTKYDAANTYFTTKVEPNMLARSQAYGGVNVNPEPINKTVGKNPVTGNISYNYSFNDRPSNLTTAKSESINITDHNPADVFAEIAVIGRQAGAVLQTLSAKTSRRRDLSIELVPDVPKYGSGVVTEINTDSIVNLYTPSPAFVIFKSQDQKSFDVKTGRVGRQVSWTFEV